MCQPMINHQHKRHLKTGTTLHKITNCKVSHFHVYRTRSNKTDRMPMKCSRKDTIVQWSLQLGLFSWCKTRTQETEKEKKKEHRAGRKLPQTFQGLHDIPDKQQYLDEVNDKTTLLCSSQSTKRKLYSEFIMVNLSTHGKIMVPPSNETITWA